MNQTIQAIFDQGVLRPLEPLDLRDQQLVVITVLPPPTTDLGVSAASAQRESLLNLVESLTAITEPIPDDRLTGRDHDQLIYGK